MSHEQFAEYIHAQVRASQFSRYFYPYSQSDEA
jgi:hypothetical protein